MTSTSWRRATCAGALLAGLTAASCPLYAQTKKSPTPVASATPISVTPAIGQPLPARRVPDVQIVAALIPAGPQMGDFSISAVYPGKVPQADAEKRARRLLGLTGWRSSPLHFEDRALERTELNVPLDKPLAPLPVMSSVSFTTPDRVVDAQNGTIAVESFIRAYRDLGRVHITYIIPGNFPFHGLREFSSPDVDVRLSGGGGAYTYVVDVKNHNLDVLNLPREQDAPSVATTTPPVAPSQRHNYGVLYAALLALGVGVAAFLYLRR